MVRVLRNVMCMCVVRAAWSLKCTYGGVWGRLSDGLVCVLSRVLERHLIMLAAIGLEKLSNFWNKWIIGIGLIQQGTDGEKDLADRQCGTPVIFEDVETDTSLRVDIAVIDLCDEANFWWLEWIVRGELNLEIENTVGIGSVSRTNDRGNPVE